MEKVDMLKTYGVDVDASLEFWSDLDTYEENLKEFKDSLNDKIDNLEYYKRNLDWENYGILSHSTKSEAKYLGFMSDAEVFLQHELAGKNSDSEYIENHFEDLKNTINNIINLLEKYFRSNDSEEKIILIADDSNIMLNFIEQTIGDEYEVVKASNGKIAIEYIDTMNIYAILLDLNMPNTNGFEVLEYMKEKNYFEKVPVVIVTGDDTEETIKKAFTYPILDVLNKPFKEDNIKRILVSINSFYENK